MKKIIFVLGLVVVLSSCGGAAKEEAPVADSTTCCADSTKCDSAVVATPTVAVDTTK
jgi:hypothetical protein